MQEFLETLSAGGYQDAKKAGPAGPASDSNLSLCQTGSYPLSLNNPDDRGAVFLAQETYQSPEQRSIRIFHTNYRGS